MLPALLMAFPALGIAVFRLWSYRMQMLDMARVLEETPAQSNLRLTVRMSGAVPRRLCQAVNARLEEGRRLRMETLAREQELKYTMAPTTSGPLWPGPWGICSCWRGIGRRTV